jgi:hypothetical protein
MDVSDKHGGKWRMVRWRGKPASASESPQFRDAKVESEKDWHCYDL